MLTIALCGTANTDPTLSSVNLLRYVQSSYSAIHDTFACEMKDWL